MTDLLQAEINNMLTSDKKFRYQMLNRLQTDCDYFLNEFGNGSEHCLWAKNTKDHIAIMWQFWHSFTTNEKPQWLTKEQMKRYENKMLTVTEKEDEKTKNNLYFKILKNKYTGEWFGYCVASDTVLTTEQKNNIKAEFCEKYNVEIKPITKHQWQAAPEHRTVTATELMKEIKYNKQNLEIEWKNIDGIDNGNLKLQGLTIVSRINQKEKSLINKILSKILDPRFYTSDDICDQMPITDDVKTDWAHVVINQNNRPKINTYIQIERANIKNARPLFVTNPLFKNVFFINKPDAEEIETILKQPEQLKPIKNQKIETLISNVLPGTLSYDNVTKSNADDDGMFTTDPDYYNKELIYTESNKEMRVSDLDCGFKMFAIMKTLLQKNKITEDAMLIFENPGQQMHLSLKNKFAELLVALVKELNVNVLIETVVSNETLAYDGYMNHYGINEQSNFYTIAKTEHDTIVYENQNEDMAQLYVDDLTALAETYVLRRKYTDVYYDLDDED